MRGLVVGRFQPFHNGHRALIARALEACGSAVVAIGSATARTSLRNPFTAAERRQMVAAAFPREVASGILRVVDVPDIHDPPRYVAHVLNLTGPVDKVFGNDDETLDLFDAAGLPTERPGLVARDTNEASRLRVLMAEDDPSWRKAMPPAVAALLLQWDPGRRLRGMEAMA